MTILRRDFETYDAYVEAQGRKAKYNRRDLLARDDKRIAAFVDVFTTAKPYLNLGPVLCLGARTGAENTAAARCGFAGSVGVDLHPVGLNVRKGDWHAMPEFKSGSFSNVFSNSFDHCLHLDRAVAEIHRVLSAFGAFYLMASDKGVKNAQRERSWLMEPKHNETLYWSHSDALRDAVLQCGGFRVLKEWRDGQWGHYVFEKTS
jgi:SAM-dependent methyltransferase